jgi:hypothetical protein
VKNAVNVKLEKKPGKNGNKTTWIVWLVGASGRKMIADVLTQTGKPYHDRWYESDTYVGVGWELLYDAKQWFTKNMYLQHPEFVGDERCDICLIVGDCPAHCPIREKGY